MNPRCNAPVHEPLAHRPLADKPLGAFELAAVFAPFVFISIGYFYAAVSRSIAVHFSMDEVLAVSAAGQPSLAQVWNFIWSGTDFSPPTYHFLLHGLVKAVGAADSRLVWRLPSVLAVYSAALGVYWLLIKSRVSRNAAVLAFGIILAFSLFDYAVQARQYAFLVLALAIALVLWAGINDTRAGIARACGLWLTLAVCLCLHFYGIVEVAAIGIAELIYWISRRRFRIAVWMALLLTAPVEAALYPLASHLAAFNAADNAAPGYYATPTLSRLMDAVLELIGGGALGSLLLLMAFLVIGIVYLLRRSARQPARPAESVLEKPVVPLPRLEIVIASLCLVPAVAFGFSLFVTGSFSARYMAAVALLPAIAYPYLLDKLPSREAITLALVPLIVGVFVLRLHAPDPIGDALEILQRPRPSFPIVIGEGQLYIELMAAADATTRSNLVYLKRPPGTGSRDPTNENELIRIAKLRPDYRVIEQKTFLDNNAIFYDLFRPNGSTDTTTPSLVQKGILRGPVDAKNGAILFWAARPTQNQQGGTVR